MKKLILILIGLGLVNLNAQNCMPPSAQTTLDVNNISAGLLNGGDMFWDGDMMHYQFPKVTNGQPPKNLFFLNALWLSAFDDNSNLKVSAQEYFTSGNDFWSGPLITGASTVPTSVCNNFDRFFEIYRTDLAIHVNNINSNTLPLNISTIDTSIKEWPAKGNQYLLNTYNMDIVEDLAPFNDSNNNGIYDPENGDYPLIKGDQCIFWVFNDLGNTHQSGGSPLGVEVQCMAYAYITNNAVNNSTFYDYKIIKKTPGDLHDLVFSRNVNPDIWDFNDDFIGCDTVNNYSFAYDGDVNNYSGETAPVAIMQFQKTPFNKGLSSFIYFSTGYNIVAGDPESPAQYRNYQTGFWKDHTTAQPHPLTIGHQGQTGTIATKFAYPGNPGVGEYWSECNYDNAGGMNTPSDKRFIMSSGAYDLAYNTSLEFTIAVMVAETDPATYGGCADKDILINPIVNLVDSFLDTVNNKPYSVVISSITNFDDMENFISLFPNPNNGLATLKIDEKFKLSSMEVYDAKGTKIGFTFKDAVLDIKSKNKGIYVLKLYSKKMNKVIVKKFVLK